jgi:hypothetical protein
MLGDDDMKFALMLFVVVIAGGCASFHQPTQVREFEFNQELPNGCEHLYVTSGTGKTKEAARTKVIENVISAGGNAVVFHGGQIEFYPGTRGIKSYTHHAIIIKCPDE